MAEHADLVEFGGVQQLLAKGNWQIRPGSAERPPLMESAKGDADDLVSWKAQAATGLKINSDGRRLHNLKLSVHRYLQEVLD